MRKHSIASGPASWLAAVLLVYTLCVTGTATAEDTQKTSPIGQWKTIDDATGQARSIVKIWEENGKLFGQVQKLLNPDPQHPNPICIYCSGELKDKPVLGLRILWGLQKDKDGWSGGTILDPESGRLYKCLVSLTDGGSKLKVRGFVGLALLGRTQVWDRE